jgi:tetratricopeptide (TPR) repeat protein
MKILSSIAVVTGLLIILGLPAQAHNLNTVHGAVVDPDGTMVEKFTVVLRPLVNKPILVERKRFANGIFTIPGLDRQKYELVVSAPKYVTVRMNVEFSKNSNSTALKIVILHPLLNGKYFPGDPSVENEYRRFDTAAPDIARQSYRQGVAYHREGKLEMALAAYGAAIRLAPNYVAPLVGAGTIYLLLNRPEAGLIFLKRAEELAPRDIGIQLDIAQGLLIINDVRPAIKILEGIAETAPDKTVPYLFLARAYYMQKKYVQAEKVVQAALAQDPRLLEARQLLFNIAVDKKDYAAAREQLAKLRDTLNNRTFSSFVDNKMPQLVSVNN